MSRTQVCEWFRCFKQGRTSVESDAQVRSKTKVLLKVFFSQDGVVHHMFAPEGHTLNKEHYLQVLRRLRDSVLRKRPKKWSSVY